MAPIATEFAPAERADPDVVLDQSRMLIESPMLPGFLDHVPDMVMILNAQRQVLFANRAVLQASGTNSLEQVLGKRPGELFHCKHSAESEGGCGTTRFCSCCGAAKAILQSLSGEFAVEECRMIRSTDSGEEALDLRVWASPIQIHNQQLTFFVIANIADEKRRLWLEKVFLHDLKNSATALDAFATLLIRTDQTEKASELVRKLALITSRILDEIEAHRQLVAAENGEIDLRVTANNGIDVLEQVFAAFDNPDLLCGRRLCYAKTLEAVEIVTDRRLLLRVVNNMVKNALEGSVPGETVTMGCRRDRERVAFWVHNPTYIPENVRLQIFNRSFSTKGAGRGLGTYSMKLLTERYLEGRVSFTSSESQGTTFTVTYPQSLIRQGQPVQAPTYDLGMPAVATTTSQKTTRDVVGLSSESRADRSTSTLLLVDDDPAIHHLVHAALAEKIRVIPTLTAREGLQVAKSMSVDLVLLDLNLPDMHGLDVLSQLRTDDRNLRVVVITADDTPDSLLRAIGDNVYDYLPKPFTIEQLQEVVERGLKTHAEPEINVVSAKREWLELSIPCTRDAVERIEHFVRQLGADLALDLLDPVATAFRELLLNAVEWGGGLDPARRVRISCIRGAHMLLYRIADPGPGFDFQGLNHSAAINPEGVLGSTAVREAKGLRAGGLGIAMVKALADELVYNKAQNEVVFVKYVN